MSYGQDIFIVDQIMHNVSNLNHNSIYAFINFDLVCAFLSFIDDENKICWDIDYGEVIEETGRLRFHVGHFIEEIKVMVDM
jgi:hypothetical protein